MLLPSNDAFVGTANALKVFNDDGTFLGAQRIVFNGDSVRDAGTEVNTELDAAFINQTAPNTGETEGGVVTVHPGFNGSLGNPDGEQIILGGTNAFGDFIDPDTADFTQPGAGVAVVHINTVARHDVTDGNDRIQGGDDDDIVEGSAGNDRINGGNGYDDLSGGAGNDRINGGNGVDIIDGGAGRDVLRGGNGTDDVYGGTGDDRIFGGSGADNLSGGEGFDILFGGSGNDVLDGGLGRDLLSGGEGADIFIFKDDYGRDSARDFSQADGDRVWLSVEGIETLADVQAVAADTSVGVVLNFDADNTLTLRDLEVSDLSADDFLFA